MVAGGLQLPPCLEVLPSLRLPGPFGSSVDFLRLGQRACWKSGLGRFCVRSTKGFYAIADTAIFRTAATRGACAPQRGSPTGRRRRQAAMAGPCVCLLLAPSRPPRSVPPPRAGVGQDLPGVGGLILRSGTKGRPHLGRSPCAPTSLARTRPVTARPTVRRPPPRAWGSIGLRQGCRWQRGGGGRWCSGTLGSPSPRPEFWTAGEPREPRGAGPGPLRSPPWGRLCASRGRWGRGREREGAGGGSRCPPSIRWRHFLPPPPGAS